MLVISILYVFLSLKNTLSQIDELEVSKVFPFQTL